MSLFAASVPSISLFALSSAVNPRVFCLPAKPVSVYPLAVDIAEAFAASVYVLVAFWLAYRVSELAAKVPSISLLVTFSAVNPSEFCLVANPVST